MAADGDAAFGAPEPQIVRLGRVVRADPASKPVAPETAALADAMAAATVLRAAARVVLGPRARLVEGLVDEAVLALAEAVPGPRRAAEEG